jgi:predicted dehydrogenase
MNLSGSKTPRLALIGVTGYGRIYWQYLRELIIADYANLVAAVVINPDEAQEPLTEMKKQGTRVYSSYESMLNAEAGNVDLCLIPTGIQWHARMTIAALRAGMNVLVEKPLAGSLADVRAIRQAEQESQRWVAVGFQDLYLDEVAWLKAAVCSGAIGRVRRVRMVGAWPRPVSYFRRNGWAGRLEANGATVLDSPLNNAFAHFVNLSLFLACPEPGQSVEAHPTKASLWRAHEIESFDTGFVRAQGPVGMIFEFFVTHACLHPREPEILLEGTDGFAEWRHDESISVHPAGHNAVVRTVRGTEWVARRAMFMTVLRRLADPTAFICTTEIAEKHTAFIDALHGMAPIHEISSDNIDWIPSTDDNDPVPVVEGLLESLNNSLTSALLDDQFIENMQMLLRRDGNSPRSRQPPPPELLSR